MSSHPQASISSWSRQEFAGLDLGDTCLNDKLVDIADALATQLMSPIGTACGDWSAIKAALSPRRSPLLPKSSFGSPNSVGSWDVRLMVPRSDRLMARVATVNGYLQHFGAF